MFPTLHKGLMALLVLLVALGVGACQRFAQETPVSPTDTPTQAAPSATATLTPGPLAAIGSRILYVGNDFTVHTINPDGTGRRRLIQQEGLYTWPTWSPDDTRVAFSSFSQDPLGPGKALYSTDTAGSELTLLFENAPESGPAIGLRIPHYSMWSPDGQHVAFLAVGESGLSLYVVRGSGQAEVRFITAGAPLYLAWSRDSKSLLVHRESGLFRVDMDATERLLNLEADSLGYRAPAWSPSSDATAFLVSERGRETLYVALSDGSQRRALGRIEGFGAFLWAPQGNRLAVGQSLASDDPLMQDIQVVDVESGSAQVVVQRPVLAFFWSPDGSKIAYVAVNDSQPPLQWRVVDLGTGQDTKIVDFHPSSDQLMLLAFFDQYAASHQVWSPDSQHLVFAGLLADGASEGSEESAISEVFVLDAEGDVPPQAVAPGLLASWSAR